MNNYLLQIIKNRYPCYFISPHFDDALLSAGEIIRFLSLKTSVTIITVFTKADNGPQTLSAKKHLRQVNFNNPKKYYHQRLLEDTKIQQSLQISSVNLGYIEALWRTRPKVGYLRLLAGKIIPEFLYIYPTYRFHIITGKISTYDQQTIINIKNSLLKILPSKSHVFCPYGIGNHVDHLIVRRAVEMICKPNYWLDQPYVVSKKIDPSHFRNLFTFTVNQENKNIYLRKYQTQFNTLFENQNNPKIDEYLIPAYA